ncbi:hypothetical protein LGQ03_16605, partial [Loktanella sp. TSTF-M6]
DDPTELLIAPVPALELEKVLTQGGTAVDDTLVFTLTAVNLGNVTLSDPVLTDTFTRLDGTAITGVVPVLADPAVAGTPLAPGDTRVWTLEHTLTQADIDAGGVSNTATLTTQTPDGDPLADVSDNGIDGDGNTADDPTVQLIAPTPALDVTKVITQTATAVGDTVIFEITATNTGNVTLFDAALTDSFTRADGTVVPNATPVLVSGGAADDPLAPGASRVWRLTHVLTQADIDAGGLSNSATVATVTPAGDPVSDMSDDGNDADGNTIDDPTEL